MPAASVDLRLSEVVAALTYALDVTEGQPEGHAVRTSAIGMRIAERLGMSSEQRSAVYYALLLKDLGCSANSARIAAAFAADDLRVKRAYKRVDLDDLRDGLRFVLGHAGRDAWRKGGVRSWWRHVRGVASGEDGGARAWTELRCERGAEIARELGFAEATAAAIRALDEHWDGGGHPYGLAGQDIPIAARILCLAQTVEVFHAARGPVAARAVAKRRAGRWFDPEVVEAFLAEERSESFWERVAGPDVERAVAMAEPPDRILAASEHDLDRVAAAFARVIDAKSPWTYRHSERVAAVADGIAVALGADAAERSRLSRAAQLHDLGKLAVPNTVLDKPGKLTEAEFTTIRAHPALSERIVRRVAPFAQVADVVGRHHERLDGRGYHRGSGAERLTRPDRILAVADAFEAMTAARPYREGMPAETALARLRSDDGLDAGAVQALAGFLATPAGVAWLADAGKGPVHEEARAETGA